VAIFLRHHLHSPLSSIRTSAAWSATTKREPRIIAAKIARCGCTNAARLHAGLSLPRLRLSDAKLKFHQAYNELTRERILAFRALVRQLSRRRAGSAWLFDRQYKVLSGVELIALGVRDCARGDRVMVAAKKRRRRARSDRLPIPLRIPCAKSLRTCRWRWRTPWPRRGRPAGSTTSRSPTASGPPALARLAGDAEARAGRSPNSSAAAAASGHELHVGRGVLCPIIPLIAGRSPFSTQAASPPAVYSPRADVEPSKDEKFGG